MREGDILAENNGTNVSKEEPNKKIDKCITPKSFAMDINILKAPLFLYNNYKPIRNKDGKIIKDTVEEKEYEWVDSKKMNRRLKMHCIGRLPRQFESDTIHGLIGLFIRKHAPFPFNNEKNQYEIDVNKLEFSWYELCAFMRIPHTGYYIDRLKEAIRILKQTQYFSYENGVIYDKSNQRYLKSGEEGMSLIVKYQFKTNKKTAINDEYSTTIDSNVVVFDELIINNLRYEYLKYLDIEMFFNKIPSGIGRGLYGYLEANRYNNNGKSLLYVKRNYSSLKVGIPVDFDYPYQIKQKLRKPLRHKVNIGYLKDFAFGDELLINGEKEECVYFCFGVTAEELKTMLERKKVHEQLQFDLDNINNNVSKLEMEYLKLPSKSLAEELIDRKVDKEFAIDIVSKKDKWFIIKHIIWIDKQLSMGKKMDTGALLGFALRRENGVELKGQHQDIDDFVEIEKLKENSNKEETRSKLKERYNNYVNVIIEEYKKTDEYQVFKEILLSDMNSNIDTIIKNTKIMGGDISLLEEFKKLQEESEYFKTQLVKEVKLIKKIIPEEEYISKLVNEENDL